MEWDRKGMKTMEGEGKNRVEESLWEGRQEGSRSRNE